jgi:hypothetical protein
MIFHNINKWSPNKIMEFTKIGDTFHYIENGVKRSFLVVECFDLERGLKVIPEELMYGKSYSSVFSWTGFHGKDLKMYWDLERKDNGFIKALRKWKELCNSK